ncbi:hypothetical protein V2A60_004326 [Cordyceps javanica]
MLHPSTTLTAQATYFAPAQRRQPDQGPKKSQEPFTALLHARPAAVAEVCPHQGQQCKGAHRYGEQVVYSVMSQRLGVSRRATASCSATRRASQARTGPRRYAGSRSTMGRRSSSSREAVPKHAS